MDRAARRLEQLAEGRRERLRDLARVRALEDETAQVSTQSCMILEDGVSCVGSFSLWCLSIVRIKIKITT